MIETNCQAAFKETVYHRKLDEGLFDSVVFLSPYFWNFRDDMWQTTHHIAQAFARLAPTVLVEPPPLWNPRSAEFRVHRLLHSIVGVGTRAPEPNLTVFHRRGLPFGRFKFVREFDLTRNAQRLRGFLKVLGFRRTLLWHSFPYWSEPLLEAVGHSIFVYHCLDHSTREEEIRLIRHADAIFCVTQTLVEKHILINPRTFLLPNGVDLTLFDRNRAAAGQRPPGLPSSGRLLGFLGYLNYHVDVELLVQVARAFPNDYLILVGRVATNETAPKGEQRAALNTLQSMTNVRLLGFKPTEQLPLYLQAFDLCLVPFLRNRFNEECDPLKFYQYAALGKPIVTTPVRVANQYRDLCYVADSADEFVRCISVALKEPNSEALAEKRVAMARAHSWQSLVAQACQMLGQLSDLRTTQSEGRVR